MTLSVDRTGEASGMVGCTSLGSADYLGGTCLSRNVMVARMFSLV